ncbi:MAG: 4-alpha-glucanotransferase [Lachnospiraceae bacterium]
MRECGILLPISSLPSAYGIGSFSKEAYEFVDFLEASGQQNWQILPLGPTGYGDSPYQSFSTFAGNPYYINLDELAEEGLLTADECAQAVQTGQPDKEVDYGFLYQSRSTILHKAYGRFAQKVPEEFEEFCRTAEWLEEYALFMAIKSSQTGASWHAWPVPLRDREPAALQRASIELADSLGFYKFEQFMFDRQWKRLKAYANEKHIKIIGDIPIYVAFDSADTWAAPQIFQFDALNTPMAVAGCPPDAFSKDGQLWGNPLYRWEYHKATGYAWWIHRIRHCFTLYDTVRVDHFRGFDEYYSIAYGAQTAIGGTWMPGPGRDLFDHMEQVLGALSIIAEDLGYVTESVTKLVQDTGYPGMKVLQFAFDEREPGNYLPYTYPQNSVIYTGTHDNDTIQGWFAALRQQDRQLALDYMRSWQRPLSQLHWDFIALALQNVAKLCIIPMQDYLGLGSEARMNTPSTFGNNWKWRMSREDLTQELRQRIHAICSLYGRI